MKLVTSFVILVLLFSSLASAGTLAELGGTYISDSLSASADRTSSKYFYQVGVLFSLDKRIWGGWNFSGISHNDDDGTTKTTFSGTDTGPYMKWQFGKNEIFSLGGAYNILSRASYDNGTETENWEGTSLWLQFAMAPEVKEGLHVGVSLNYYQANYTKKIVNNVESSASNSKSWIFPMLMVTKQW